MNMCVWFWSLGNHFKFVLPNYEKSIWALYVCIWTFESSSPPLFLVLMVNKLISFGKKSSQPTYQTNKSINKQKHTCKRQLNSAATYLLLRELSNTPVNPLSPAVPRIWWHSNNKSIELPSEIISQII